MNRKSFGLVKQTMAAYNFAMQEFTHLSHRTSEEHKDLTQARIKRDHNDLGKIWENLLVARLMYQTLH
jgi:hypothetical protein